MADYILLRHRDIPDLHNIDVYRKNGGFESLKKVITGMDPDDVTNEVKASGLRGRGGAGFPTGMKWSFIDGQSWPHYVVANADESEPGTFKDREIMEGNPYQFLEGVAICAYAVKATDAYIYLRGEFWQIAQKLDACISEMENAGLLGEKLFGTNTNIRLHTHLGAGAYICGEESACSSRWKANSGSPACAPPSHLLSGSMGNRPL
jgi:NADH-quinone oxidoreductase subunit F